MVNVLGSIVHFSKPVPIIHGLQYFLFFLNKWINIKLFILIPTLQHHLVWFPQIWCIKLQYTVFTTGSQTWSYLLWLQTMTTTPSIRLSLGKWEPLADGCLELLFTVHTNWTPRQGGLIGYSLGNRVENTFLGHAGVIKQTPLLRLGDGYDVRDIMVIVAIDCQWLVFHSLACLVSNIAWHNVGDKSMKPLDSDEEEAEQLGAYQKELRRK